MSFNYYSQVQDDGSTTGNDWPRVHHKHKFDNFDFEHLLLCSSQQQCVAYMRHREGESDREHIV